MKQPSSRSHPGYQTPGAALAWRRWLILLPILFVIAILSMAVHDVAIEHLGVPYPTLVNSPAWVGVAGATGRILALIVFALVAHRFFDARLLPTACLIVGGLEAALSERLRVKVIELFLTEGWRDGSWHSTFLGLLSPLLPSLAQGVAAMLLVRLVVPRSKVWAIITAVLCGAVIQLVLAPLATEATTWLQSATGAVEPTQLHFEPYAGLPLVMIYLTFIEPTLAGFIMARLAWPGLSGRRPARVVLFALLVFGCAGRFTSFLLTTFWVQQPPLLAIASTGQFAAETLVMAVLTGWLASSALLARPTPNAETTGD